MGLKEKLDLIESCKTDIRNKIIDKGVYVAESTPFKDYPNYINNIGNQSIEINDDVWTPDPEWWDIETILANDVNEGDNAWLDECGKMIVLYNDVDDVHNFYTCSNQVFSEGSCAYAVKTSDGQLYIGTSTSSSGSKVSHTWDRTQDKASSNFDIKTRYAIFYKSPDVAFRQDNTSNFGNAIYVINDGIYLLGVSSDMNGIASVRTLKAFKEKSGKMEAQYEGYYFFDQRALEYLEFSQPFLTTKQVNYFKRLADKLCKNCTLKLGVNSYRLEGEQRVYDACNTSNTNGQNLIIDVTDIDFTDCYNQIFTNTYINKIKGVINLENNSVNTSYTLFKTSSSGNSSKVFSLNLPPNADVTLNVNYAAKETLKYLVENAPIITETHTLTIPTSLYYEMKYMPYDCPIVYNGENYSNGVQVLTLKGWTIQTM